MQSIEPIPRANRENVRKATENNKLKRVLSCFRFQLVIEGESLIFCVEECEREAFYHEAIKK